MRHAMGPLYSILSGATPDSIEVSLVMKVSNLLIRTVFCTVLAFSGIINAGPAPAATLFVGQDPPDKESNPVFPGMRQPGDDELFELKDESHQLDKKNTDALAWYMAGLAAQRRGDLKDAAAAFEKASQAAPDSAAPLRARALLLFRMGRGTDGLRVARRAIELDPDDFETRLQLAVILASRNDLQEPPRLLDQALASKRLSRASKEFVVLHQIRARLMMQIGKVPEAADSYEVIFQALERPEDFGLQLREHQALTKDRTTGYAMTGRVLMEAGRTDKAVEVFQALCRVEDERPGEHNLLLAQALYQKDELEESEKNLNLYFETGQRNSDSLVLLQDLLAAQSRSTELVPRLEELAKDSSDATLVRLFTGRVLLNQGDSSAAAETFRSVLDDTGDVDAYLGLIRVAIADRDTTGLLATLNRAGRSRLTLAELRPLTPGVVVDDQFTEQLITECETRYNEEPNTVHPVVTAFCALIAQQVEDQEAEGNLLKATLELNPDRELLVSTLERYGMNLLMQENNERAAATFRRLYSMPGLGNEQRLMALYRLSQAEAFAENYESALESIQTALRAAPGIPLLHYQQGWIQAQAGDLDAAKAVLEKTVKDFAADRESTERCSLLLAGISAQQSQWIEAVTWYEAVIKAEGTDAATIRMCQLGLSNAWVQNGDVQKGEDVLVEVYESDPSDPGVNNDLGYLWADGGKNLEQAEKMIRIAVATQPENSAYLDSLGWVLFRLGKNEEAAEALIKANADPNYRDTTLLEHLGDVFQALKKMDKAQEAWQEALDVEEKSDRTDDEIVERLKQKLAPLTSSDEDGDGN
jgi:tetratricopeptide (TPR) repeat protein